MLQSTLIPLQFAGDVDDQGRGPSTDAGYQGVAKRLENRESDVDWQVAMRPGYIFVPPLTAGYPWLDKSAI